MTSFPPPAAYNNFPSFTSAVNNFLLPLKCWLTSIPFHYLRTITQWNWFRVYNLHSPLTPTSVACTWFTLPRGQPLSSCCLCKGQSWLKEAIGRPTNFLTGSSRQILIIMKSSEGGVRVEACSKEPLTDDGGWTRRRSPRVIHSLIAWLTSRNWQFSSVP